MSDRYFNRLEGHFQGFQNTSLYYQEWLSKDPKGLLIITHGHGEHSECYLRLVNGLSTSGWSICCWDWRGHGRSDGKRGYAANFSDYCEDYNLFLNFILTQENVADLPVVVLGHSMGGLIQAKTLYDKGANLSGRIQAQIYSAPLMGLSVDVPLVKDLAALMAYHIYPKLTLWNELKKSQFTSDAKVLEEYDRDPLRHDQISPGVYLGVLKALEKVEIMAKNSHLPTLMQLGKNDTVVSNESAISFFNSLNSTIKNLIVYDNSLHEIYNDIEREKSYSDLIQFLKPFQKNTG